MKIIERISGLVESHNMKKAELCRVIGVSTGNYCDWESGRSIPKVEPLCKIADHFGVTVDYLLGRSELPAAPASDESDAILTALIGDYTKLNADGKAKLADYAADLVSSGRYIKTSVPDLGAKEA